MSSYLKVGVGVLVVAGILWWILKPPHEFAWVEKKGGDIYGFDMETDTTNMPVDSAKVHASKIGARSFLKHAEKTFFKSADGPIIMTPNGDFSVYVLE